MAIKIFGTTLIGGEAQRKEASANEFSSKYPLSNDCDVLKTTINAAKAELATINASRPATAGGKRIKDRNSNALKVWLNEMNNYLKDLTCGIVGGAQGQAMTFAPTPVVYTKDVIKAFTPPTPTPVAPTPITPTTSTTTTQTTTQEVVSTTLPLTPTPQLAMEYGNGEANAVVAPTTDNTQKYLIYGGIGLLAVLVINKLVNR